MCIKAMRPEAAPHGLSLALWRIRWRKGVALMSPNEPNKKMVKTPRAEAGRDGSKSAVSVHL
jgi:hypothetical protein